MGLEFRVIVCGGRNYGWQMNANRTKTVNKVEVEYLFRKLDLLIYAVEGVIGRQLVIIQGEADGADAWAKKWAEINSIKTLDFPADWDTHKKSAGFIRNKQMLDEGNPELVIAFKGGNGTAMMVDIARNGKVPVKEYYE